MNFDSFSKIWDTDKRINRAKIIANEISNLIVINANYSAIFDEGKKILTIIII